MSSKSSKTSTTTTTTTISATTNNDKSNMSHHPSSLEMSRMSHDKRNQTASRPADNSLVDGGDVTDDVIDSEADTTSYEQDYQHGHNTTTTSIATAAGRRCDTEDDEEATATGATATGDDDDDDEATSCDGETRMGRKRKRKQRRVNKRGGGGGDDALLIASSRDKKSLTQEPPMRNGTQGFSTGVSNSAASVNKLDEDCWSNKDLERDTPSPNLDESKKNWETRCIAIVVVLLVSVAAGIFLFFLTGQSKGKVTIDFRFANQLSSHMVLQGAPNRAVIWGYGPKPHRDEDLWVVVRMYSGDALAVASPATQNGGPAPTAAPSFEYQTKISITAAGSVWRVVVGPVFEAGPFRITASLELDGLTHVTGVDDVLFGDVWLCTGHDRLYESINKLLNYTEEEMTSASGGGDDDDDDRLRIFSVFPAKSDIPWYDVHVVDINWSVASRSFLPRIRDRGGHSTPSFPAPCWLFGQRLKRHFGKPVGLVAATYGDSSIEDWPPSGVIDVCSLEYPDTSSRIWNGMIHPLLDMQVKGLVWQQGNFYGEEIPVNYSCSVKEFLNQWRIWMHKRWTGGDNQSEIVPTPTIGVIQMLPANSSQYGQVSDMHAAQLRWMVSDGHGELPSGDMRSIFLVVTIDLPNPEDIRQMRVIADRLFRGFSCLAYKEANVEFKGPIPSKYVAKSQNSLALTFETTIEIRSRQGFEICCSKARNLTCRGESMGSSFFWTDSQIVSISDSTLTISGSDCPWHIVGFRYAWSDTPCAYLECPVYSRRSGLPMPPFLRLGLLDDGFVRELARDPVAV